MSFQLSAGVNVSEIDLTTIVPAVATTIAGLAGRFAWGPVEEVLTISDENQLVSTLGKPDANTFLTFFTGANFLSYAQDMRVVRAANTGTKNATANGVAFLIKNETDYEQNYSSGANTAGQFAAKYPGTLGNNITVYVADSNTFSNTWSTAGTIGDLADLFDSAPATSDWASTSNSANDEMHIVVVDTGSKITGVANTILERFAFVSKASDAKNSDGTSNYYKDVINRKSKYVWWMAHPGGSITNWGTPATGAVSYNLLATTRTFGLSGGIEQTVTVGDLERAYDFYKNPDTINISLLMSADAAATVSGYLIDMAETRMDCIACVSPPLAAVVDNIGTEGDDTVTYRNTLTSSSYAVMDSGWKYQYDKYNDVYRWIPLNGDIAGLIVRTDNQRDPWYSPGGFNRGVLKNVVKLAWNPSKAERDKLYKSGINPVVTFPGEGTILYGDKTLLARPSAFDRINVRRLFIVLEKSISRAARSSLFEFNDEFTRAQFVSMVEPYLRDIQGRRGIFDYRVVCDTTNNTPEVIDSNRFIGDIYIKPARSINFIQLNFVAVRTGVSFDEIVGKFG